MAAMDFDKLWRAHPTHNSNQLPCRRENGQPSYANQCAIRLGVTFRLAGLPPGTLRGLITCGVHPADTMHYIRAQELANSLARAAGSIDGLGPVEKLKGEEPSQFTTIIFGRRGIIFLKDYWPRKGERERGTATGDHIDLWNGYRTSASWLMEYFSWLGYHGGYGWSKEIWFWPVDS